MSLFDLVVGRKRARRKPDRVFMSKDAKWRSLAGFESARFIAHFPDTRRDVQEFARAQGLSLSIGMASDLSPDGGRDSDASQEVVVLERHPLREHDERVGAWADGRAGSLVFLVSLDDPLLSAFAGNLRSVLERLGMDSNEAIEHSLVSKSIASAQDKIKKTAISDLSAASGDQWLRMNVQAGAD